MSGIEELGLVRIDDRLIHGQVVTVWCRHQHITRILVVDDDVAADSFMQEVLRLAAPPGLIVEAMTLQDAIQEFAQERPDRATTMVLLKSPRVAQALYDGGVTYKALNIGGMGSAPGRKNVFKNIAISNEEIVILKRLLQAGVKITLLTVPGEKSKDFADLAGKL